MKPSKAYYMNENWSASARLGFRVPFILLVAAALVIAILLAGDPAEAAGHFQRLKSFGFPDQVGTWPRNALIQGKRWGLSRDHPPSGTAGGTVFRAVRRRERIQSPARFCGGFSLPAGRGAGSDGVLYGTTYSGGSNNVGILFALGKDGQAIAPCTSSKRTAGTARDRLPALALGRDGVLYGVTQDPEAAATWGRSSVSTGTGAATQFYGALAVTRPMARAPPPVLVPPCRRWHPVWHNSLGRQQQLRHGIQAQH